MDAPDHMKYRLLTQSWFMPKNLRAIEARVREIARETVDAMLAGPREIDFARDVAAAYPLRVIMNVLGVPREDEPRMLMLTQQLFGSTDPELNRARAAITSADQAIAMLQHVIADFYAYFRALTDSRRANPQDDIATVLAQATINGQPLPDRETNDYYMIVATAGHDTTSASTAGAIMELAKSPELFARYRQPDANFAGLIEEAIRWTTPVQHFMRSATEDTHVGGQAVARGDWLMLCYISGNRDAVAIPHADTFDPDRSPNPQNRLRLWRARLPRPASARMEMRILFEELLPRLSLLELTGEPARVEATFVGG